LLDPLAPAECRCWQLGDGPSIRFVEAAEDAIRSLVWEVDSLGRAADWLRRQGWLGEEHGYRVAIAPEPLQGLEVWLTGSS
jgi:hypothetical protein